MPPPRKKREELIARYRLEPTIRDVFVEGKADANLIARYLESRHLRNVVVYEISSIEIPAADLINAGRTESARERVIFRAVQLQNNLPIESQAATCVIDRDYDIFLDKNYACPFLMILEHSSLEMYAFNPETLDCVLRAVAPNLDKNGELVLKELEEMLRQVFTIRATSISLGLKLEWLTSFPEDCSLTEHGVRFDEDNFIHRYLSKNACLREKDRFLQKLKDIRSMVKGDRRLYIRGHDFVDALSWYIRKNVSKSSPLHRPDVLQQLLLAYIDCSRLSHEQFFQDLSARVGSSV